ncbi:TPA: hypothetical protein QDB28_005228 [Burkholderia vietnamiensis]|uniref:hypothetical protein n=1 Tax=Burkholderia vietnamiensis TaxID=60552 RepID=UPI00158F607B|nr:hypothetical protein [Burkholderia vietnamiensis]HDR9164793.1 hypothetical protein [Burkholderia vietnamiensis]
MGSLLDLFNDGVEITRKILGLFREGDETRGSNGAEVSRVELQVLDPSVLRSIEVVSAKLDSLAGDVELRVTQRLETQELEKLAAVVRSAKTALEFGNQSLLASTLASLSERVEYARNRLAEGNADWLSLWMAGESMRIACLSSLADNDRAREIVARETHAFRLNILTFSRSIIFDANQIPWVAIADFVNGKGEQLLTLLEQNNSTAANDLPLVYLRIPEKEGAVMGIDFAEISEITVSVGDAVVKGQRLIFYRNSSAGRIVKSWNDALLSEVVAPFDGVVTKVNVETGLSVPWGSVVAVMEKRG